MIEDKHHQTTIINLLRQDELRVKALDAVYQLNLAQSYIAAGFVRNLVWDHLHHKPNTTVLNDIDVIYFEPDEHDSNQYQIYESKLNTLMPQLNWQVRNQAFMHHRNGDKPYTSILDAMSYWPEKETAVAVQKVREGQYECISAFGFETLFKGHITHNPKRTLEIFEQRVQSKGWLRAWPGLKVV